MTADTAKPASVGSIDDDEKDDFVFPRGGSGRKAEITTRGGSGTRKKRASRRTKQFTTKADPVLLDIFYAVLDDLDFSTVTGFENAIKDFLRKHGREYK